MLESLSVSAKRELAELLDERHRRECRRSFLTFCIEALEPFDLAPAAHHRLLIDKLQAVADGKIRRLMVLMPPGSAKSLYASKLFPAWYLSLKPHAPVIGASHTQDLADKVSRETMGYIKANAEILGYHLASESMKAWNTTNGGEYKAAGIGGPITGRRADLAIIDDPVKDRQKAESAGDRDTQWHWFTSTLRSRLKPSASIVLIMTRWHEDDLGGRMLRHQAHRWEVIKLPAMALKDDPLGRAPGEFLWGDDNYNYANDLKEVLAECEENGAMRDWQALYQQEPRPLEGSLFKTANLSVLDAIPAGGLTGRAWDLAATKAIGTRDPDWTVGVKLTRTGSGHYVVGDVVRIRGGPDEVEAAIVNTAKLDGAGVRIGLPQDPGQAGKTQVLYLTRKLAGHMIDSSPETGDKATRAAPVASQCNVGNLSMVRAPWNAAFRDELAAFPSGSHDDQVDALSRAFSMVGMSNGPIAISPELLAASRRARGAAPARH